MAATPASDHTEEFEQLAGLAALNLLEDEELELFEQHAARCERCQVMVRLDRETLARVALAAPDMDPSPDFKQRLMARGAAELDAASGRGGEEQARPTRPTPIGTAPTAIRAGAPRLVPFWRRTSFISALAAVLVVGLASFGAYTFVNQPVATVQLSGSAPGSATVIVRRSGAAELDMSGVPDPGQGFVYEAWVIPQGQVPIAAGTTSTGTTTLSLPGNVRGATVAITRERGPATSPTTPILLMGTVQS